MGEWIFKKKYLHRCQPPTDDVLNTEIGSHSVWKCDCGQFWSTSFISEIDGKKQFTWIRIYERDVEGLRRLPEGTMYSVES